MCFEDVTEKKNQKMTIKKKSAMLKDITRLYEVLVSKDADSVR